MALESLLTSLKSEVSGVSGVQPCSHAALQRYPMKFAEVSGVSQCMADTLPDTLDTSRNRQGYQRKPASSGACTPDTLDTPQNDNTETKAPKVGAGGTAIERLGRIAIRVLGRVSGPHPDGTMSLHVSAARSGLIELAEKRGIEVFRPSADAAILAADAAALCDLVEAATRLDDKMRPCTACHHLRGEVCRAAEPGGIVSAARGYRPVEPGKPRRCAGFEGCDVAG